MPSKVDPGHLDLQRLPGAQCNFRPLALKFQPLRIENKEITLEARKRNHALNDEFGQLNEEA